MDKFKSFLIKHLILVLVIVVAIELILTIILNDIIFPFIGFLMGQPGLSSLSIGSIPFFIWGLITGNSAFVFNALETSTVIVLILFSLLLVMLPIIVGILIYARMVTRQVEILEKERADERKSYEAKRNLMLSDFAHDLRTPIMTIGGYANAITDGIVKDEAQKTEYLTAIATKSKRMTELITMLFEYVRVGSEGFLLTRKKIDLHALLTEIIASLYPDLEGAGMDVDIDIPEEPFFISADELHLKRVIENLIINIIRHNPSGTKAGFIIKKAPGVEFLAVADTGVQMEKTEDELFEPFVKGEDSRSKNTGSGLGLSVVKQVMDMHGFDIHLKQPYGEYTKAFVLKFTESSIIET
jgi:signal transduction histidine kinase